MGATVDTERLQRLLADAVVVVCNTKTEARRLGEHHPRLDDASCEVVEASKRLMDAVTRVGEYRYAVGDAS